MTGFIRTSRQTALNAIVPGSGNRQHLITKNSLLQVENSASVATKLIGQMTGFTRVSPQTALNAIKPKAGNRQLSTTKSILLQVENSASVATRLISPRTKCTANLRQAVELAIVRSTGNRQHLTIADISDSTVITGQIARHAIPIQATTKNIPVITAMNTPNTILQTSIVKRESTITRTA